jgi:CO dehydrogenase/acetyl-CoA synthase epsilon subunit
MLQGKLFICDVSQLRNFSKLQRIAIEENYESHDILQKQETKKTVL